MIVVSFMNFPVSAQESGVCCERSGDSFCTFTPDASICETGFSSELGRNYRMEGLACNQLDSCELVCCVDDSGKCSAQMPRIQCLAQGGLPKTGADCSSLSDCSIGSCVIQNQCSAGLTALECRLRAEEMGLDYEFSTEYQTVSECYTHMTSREGCCVLGGDECVRTTSDGCSGEFNPNKLCSGDEFVGKCKNQRMDHKGCGLNGEDVFWYDSEDQLENMIGVPYDGTIKYDSVAGPGNCDLASGTVCGLEGGEYQCVDINCDVGDVFTVEVYEPATGESIPRDITVTQEMLGGGGSISGALTSIDLPAPTTRRNGESWCSYSYYDSDHGDMFIDSHATSYSARHSAGARHYVRSCVLGKIVVEACDVMRNTVCMGSTQEINAQAFGNAACVENQAEKCIKIGDGSDRGGRCTGNPFCHYDTEMRNECWPKELYAPAGTKYCGDGCGKGWRNQCDKNECRRRGDCFFKDDIKWWHGALIGAGAATVAWAGYTFIPGTSASITDPYTFLKGLFESSGSGGGPTVFV